MNSGYESNGYGLINLDGTLTDRAEAAGRVARIIQRNAAAILAAQPARAEVAILFNRLSYMVGGAQPSLSKLGNAPRDSLMGLHRSFFEAHIPADFVHPEDVTQDRLGQYKILFLPYPVMLSQDVARGVERFIRNGGTVVAEARLAWNDERGFSSDVIPGFGLHEVFGAREKIIRPVETTKIFLESPSDFPGMKLREAVTAEAFEEALIPEPGARVLARFADGEPAMVAKAHGKGKAILVGSFLALAAERHTDAGTKRLLRVLARAAGVAQEVDVSGPGTSEVEIRRLTGDGVQILFVFNHAKTPAQASFSLRLPWPVREARDLVKDQALRLRSVGDKTVFEKTLGAGETWVLKLERQ